MRVAYEYSHLGGTEILQVRYPNCERDTYTIRVGSSWLTWTRRLPSNRPLGLTTVVVPERPVPGVQADLQPLRPAEGSASL
jgi:hypothetical protein